MSPESLSAKFIQIYNTLPPEAQQALIEKHLAGLIDLVPKNKSKKVLAAATRLQARHKNVPTLDLRTKRKQVNALMDELNRDAKSAFIKERSNRDELLFELIDSLTSWLNAIWSVAYEHNVNFVHAHSCLLFVADVFTQLFESAGHGGCKCSVMNLPISVTIKNKHGKTIKNMHVTGPQNVDRILLWIWRDLFVSMSAKGTQQEKNRMRNMLEDIENVLGFETLERLLYGGKRSVEDEDEDDDDDDEDEDEEEWEDDEDASVDGSVVHVIDEDEDDNSASSDSRCPCNFHAPHWSGTLNAERVVIRDLVQERLHTIFETTPSLRLYNILISISDDTQSTKTRLLSNLSHCAGSTADTLVAALDIHIAADSPSHLISLLDSHAYLLRPKDAPTLQACVAVLSDAPTYQPRALTILEKELTDSLRAIYIAIRGAFAKVDEDTYKREIGEIMKLRTGSHARRDRITRWTEDVMTSSSGPMHPMAFAAMMFGIPIGPDAGDGDDAEFINFLDLDHSDPDLDDLREEFRPKLKERFEGWYLLAQTVRGGGAVGFKIYTQAVEMMSFLKAPDAVAEMLNRLGERPSKGYVCDALDALASFCKMQKKKYTVRNENQKRTRNANAPASSPRGNANTSAGNISTAAQDTTSNSTPPPLIPADLVGQHVQQGQGQGGFSFSFGSVPFMGNPPPPPLPFPLVPGGMEDVD